MDPNACVDRICDALEDDDREEALEGLKDLSGWLNRGGFPPESVRYHRLVNRLITHMEGQ